MIQFHDLWPNIFTETASRGDLFGLMVSDVSRHPEVSVLGVRRVL